MRSWQSAALKLVLLIIGAWATLMPRSLELWLGKKWGLLLLKIGKSRRAVAFENLKRCFPEKTEQEHQALLKANFEHYGMLFLELTHLFSPLPGHYKKYVEKNTVVEGLEHWKTARDKGKGILFVSSHLGNWELMVGAGSLAGIPITMVTKHLKPEWLHQKIEKARGSLGVKGAYEPRTLPIIIKALRKGEAVGFVMDQYAGPPIGIPVPFFGVKVGTLAAVSVLIERTGAAVVTAKAYRDEKGIVHVCIEPEIDLSELASDNEKCTAFLTSRVESWVREYPQQWHWIHRRFKNVVWP